MSVFFSKILMNRSHCYYEALLVSHSCTVERVSPINAK